MGVTSLVERNLVDVVNNLVVDDKREVDCSIVERPVDRPDVVVVVVVVVVNSTSSTHS